MDGAQPPGWARTGSLNSCSLRLQSILNHGDSPIGGLFPLWEDWASIEAWCAWRESNSLPFSPQLNALSLRISMSYKHENDLIKNSSYKQV